MINFNEPPIKDVIEILLRDMNSGGNILFNGKELTKKYLPKIKPRALKSADEKFLRTRRNAEVFTPSRVVKFMVDALDDGRLDSRWLEIACGEAPFLTNRYDAETGEDIPINQRVGILDRKLHAAKNFDEAKRAVQSIYGYELQGDSLLIARANILLTFAECAKDFSDSDLAEIAEIISWNIFQFDCTKPPDSLFGEEIIDWRIGRKFVFGGNSMKKFDFVIGNPPYNEETADTSDKPIYNILMEEAHKVGEKVALITPARFLFDAGKTPKEFNKKMLNDPHFKVLDYAQDSKKYFKGVDIEGGVAITLRDATKNFGAIGTFTHFLELNSIHKKIVIDNDNFKPISDLIILQNKWNLEKLFEDYPEYKSKIGSGGTERRLTTSIFSTVNLFREDKQDGDIKILGLIKNQRVYRYISEKYLDIHHENFYKYKVFVPKSNGSGALGKVESTPLIGIPIIGEPLVGFTQSFISFGNFNTLLEAQACLKYIKSKFARALLGILKITQDNPPTTWAKVPLQDFTAASDINWTLPISEIDKQLYRKYGLDDAEINFIETHVKAMA